MWERCASLLLITKPSLPQPPHVSLLRFPPSPNLSNLGTIVIVNVRGQETVKIRLTRATSPSPSEARETASWASLRVALLASFVRTVWRAISPELHEGNEVDKFIREPPDPLDIHIATIAVTLIAARTQRGGFGVRRVVEEYNTWTVEFANFFAERSLSQPSWSKLAG